MKQVISGRLAEAPALNTVTVNEGREEKVVNFTIFAYDPNAPEIEGKDGKTYRKGIPLKCAAWGDNAVQISEMKKGSQLTAVANMRLNEFSFTEKETQQVRNISEAVYVIRKIDTENKIHKQMTSLLKGYEDDVYDTIFDEKSEQPGFKSDRTKEVNLDDKAVEKENTKTEPGKE